MLILFGQGRAQIQRILIFIFNFRRIIKYSSNDASLDVLVTYKKPCIAYSLTVMINEHI